MQSCTILLRTSIYLKIFLLKMKQLADATLGVVAPAVGTAIQAVDARAGAAPGVNLDAPVGALVATAAPVAVLEKPAATAVRQ